MVVMAEYHSLGLRSHQEAFMCSPEGKGAALKYAETESGYNVRHNLTFLVRVLGSLDELISVGAVKNSNAFVKAGVDGDGGSQILQRWNSDSKAKEICFATRNHRLTQINIDILGCTSRSYCLVRRRHRNLVALSDGPLTKRSFGCQVFRCSNTAAFSSIVHSFL